MNQGIKEDITEFTSNFPISDAVNTSGNMWSENYIPQYSGRQDFPSIPMQLPVSGGSHLEDIPGIESELLWTGTEFPPPIDEQLFWQAPVGVEYVSLVSEPSCRKR